MKSTQIVNLGRVRSLLGEWEKVRQHILAQEVTGFQVALHGSGGKETIYSGGVYMEPTRKLKATLQLSAARMLTEDEPLSDFAISQF